MRYHGRLCGLLSTGPAWFHLRMPFEQQRPQQQRRIPLHILVQIHRPLQSRLAYSGTGYQILRSRAYGACEHMETYGRIRQMRGRPVYTRR